MAWKTSDFALPERVEQATAAPGEVRVVTPGPWIEPEVPRCKAYRLLTPLTESQRCVLPEGHEGEHSGE